MKPKILCQLLFTFIIFNFSFLVEANATVRYVSKTGSSTQPYTNWTTASDSIQKCINICQSGDTVYVANGVYKEKIVMIPGLSLIGNGMDSCIIDTRDFVFVWNDIALQIMDSCLVGGFKIIVSNDIEIGIGIAGSGGESTIVKYNAILSWATATELNNRGFDLLRSTNNNDFKAIAFIKGKGNSTSINYYSYKDYNLANGNYKYRLKQIDCDGSIKYSSQLEVSLQKQYDFNLEQNYPNPFNPKTQIRYSIKEDALVTLKLFDILGNEIATLVNEPMNQGIHSVDFNSSDLSSGVYIYQLIANNFIASRKMIITK